jgi:hypothetical protein
MATVNPSYRIPVLAAGSEGAVQQALVSAIFHLDERTGALTVRNRTLLAAHPVYLFRVRASLIPGALHTDQTFTVVVDTSGLPFSYFPEPKRRFIELRDQRAG